MLNRPDSQAGAAPPAAHIGWLGARQIALGLTAGAMAGLLDLGVLLSLAALIFSGQLASFVAKLRRRPSSNFQRPMMYRIASAALPADRASPSPIICKRPQTPFSTTEILSCATPQCSTR